MSIDSCYLNINFIFLYSSVIVILALIIRKRNKIHYLIILCLISNIFFLYSSLSPIIYLNGRLGYLLNFLAFNDVIVNGLNQTKVELISYSIPIFMFSFLSFFPLFYIRRMVKKRIIDNLA